MPVLSWPGLFFGQGLKSDRRCWSADLAQALHYGDWRNGGLEIKVPSLASENGSRALTQRGNEFVKFRCYQIATVPAELKRTE